MKYPPSYARVAQMSGAELFRQLDLPAMASGEPPRHTIRVLVRAEIEARLEGKRPLSGGLPKSRKKVKKRP